VRLAVVPLTYKSLKEAQKDSLLKRIFELIPSGVGQGHKDRKELTYADYCNLTNLGARWSIEQGYGFDRDLQHMESNGVLEGAKIETVSSMAQERGKNQLGSIGSGNHFVEIGEIQKIHLSHTAEAWGVIEGDVYILIHSGSRGFGYQICQDTLDKFVRLGLSAGLPDKQLVAAPINSTEGQTYFSAMAAAANYAFNNRQQILHYVRQAFFEIFHIDPEHIRLLYDVCHNIAKFENHLINGESRRLCVHRKGATRAFGPGVEELSPLFRQTGQPVMVPGDMGRASYLLVGCGNPLEGNSLTWCSCCHGAGRARSRVQSMKNWKSQDPIKYMKQQGVQVMARSYRTIAEEMPDAYKDVEEVVRACQEAGLAKMVAKLRPYLVVKG
jgi:tRNA-splicing ligase RtcB